MEIKIVPFDPKYLPAFIELNREWIQKHFALETMDLAQLENPYDQILDKGGQILFLLENGTAVGTCAMIPDGEKHYELAKMAVDTKTRGKGYGSLLMEAAIAWAREQGATKLGLLSNTVLNPAISLYTKHGFKTTHLGPHPAYERCNIEMELTL